MEYRLMSKTRPVMVFYPGLSSPVEFYCNLLMKNVLNLISNSNISDIRPKSKLFFKPGAPERGLAYPGFRLFPLGNDLHIAISPRGAENTYTHLPGFDVKNALWGRHRVGGYDRDSQGRARQESR
jgi:hypothetical protein